MIHLGNRNFFSQRPRLVCCPHENRLAKFSLNETENKVRIGKDLSGNGLKQLGALSPLLLNVALEYAILNVQVNQEDMEMTNQILISADDIKLLSKNVHNLCCKEE